MTGFNLQAILFGLVLLILVLMGHYRESDKPNSLSANGIDFTSVGVSVKNIISQPVAKKPDNVKARAILVKQLGDDYSVLKVADDQRWPIASLTKLMTAMIALERFSPEQKIFFNDKIIATEGNSGDFRSGESFSVIDLVKALMLVSSNDAAVALAEAYGYENFIDAMQIKASELGMKQTTFFDSSGLSFLNQSTIEDLEKLVDYVYENHPEIFQFSRQSSLLIGEKRSLTNINQFADLPDFVGGKTGYTDDANGNLISLFKSDIFGRPLLIIVLGTEDRFGETKKLLDFFNDLHYNRP